MNSRILPQRFDTWLSATLIVPWGTRSRSIRMLLVRKMPCRKSLKITTSGLPSAMESLKKRKALSEMARLSTRSTWSIL